MKRIRVHVLIIECPNKIVLFIIILNLSGFQKVRLVTKCHAKENTHILELRKYCKCVILNVN